METLSSLLIIFLFLFAGMAGAGLKLILVTGYLDRIMSVALALLLFSMGLRIGMLETITQQLMRIGLLSVSFAVGTVLGTLVLLLALMAVAGKLAGAGLGGRGLREAGDVGEKGPADKPGPQGQGAEEMKAETERESGKEAEKEAEKAKVQENGVDLAEPLRLFLFVVAGFLCGYFLPLFDWFKDQYTTYLLYALLFLIGVQMVRNEVNLKRAMLHPATFLVPLLTMLGSLGGGLALSGVFDLQAGKALSLAAGFGWYSLSGVLISEMGDPVLGAAGF